MQFTFINTSILALILVISLVGCNDGGNSSNNFLIDIENESIVEECPDGMTCDYFSAPKDYDHPQLGNVNIYYGIHKALSPSERLGILVFNFGGPGAAAVPFTDLMIRYILPPTILNKFDIIGMDPRGSGGSAFSKELTECATANDCSRVYQELSHYMGSNSVVKDLDKLRETLGEDKLNFFGYSYGTRLGSLYATTFPENVRALVLDSPMPPKSGSNIDLRVGNAQGYDVVADYRLESGVRMQRLEQITSDILTSEQYDSKDEVLRVRQWAILLEKLISSDDDSSFLEMREPLYDFLDNDILSDLLDHLTASGDDEVSDEVLRMAALFTSVICTDESTPVEENNLDNSLDRFRQASTIYGDLTFVQTAEMCINWPGERDPIVDVENMEQILAGQQILIIGGHYDPNTPYAWAEQMKQSFGNLATMTTVQNLVEHGFSYTGLSCVDERTTAYLLEPTQTFPDISCDGTSTDPKSLLHRYFLGKAQAIKAIKSVRGF